MDTSSSSAKTSSLGRRVREQFVGELEAALPALVQAVRAHLSELALQMIPSTREMQERRDSEIEFAQQAAAWVRGTAGAWRRAVVPSTASAQVRMESLKLELLGDEAVEGKILASHLAVAIHERASAELNDLKARILHLENLAELASDDLLRPEALAQLLLEQWLGSQLTRGNWTHAAAAVQKQLVPVVEQAYQHANQTLVGAGVLPDIKLAARVRRGTDAPTSGPGGVSSGSNGGLPATGSGSGGGGGGGWGVGDETRMLTASTPLARARARATGVMGQLRRMLGDRVPGFDATRGLQPSPELARALGERPPAAATQVQTQVQDGTATQADVVVYDAAAVRHVATELRQRSGALKKKASTQAEKATIEIVALMFQSILAEERIPPSVRVWVARLQMPVLRVALAEPEFFGTLQHPARQLIDRMGSCVLGFEAGAINGSALELEIKRVVQVIEQYPETGRRVFQLVYDEFQKFLAKFLTGTDATQKLVSVAQQVEQKETLAVQYTIELRNMLSDIPVREEIRQFLFKVWAEVLSVAAVKNGPQHEQTLALKKSAAELVWAASAKPNRAERAQVIQGLPQLLQRLRQGMALMGLQGPAQETHIKVIGDTLADAFQSKTQAIAPERIQALTERLAHLEDFVADDPTAELLLNADNIEMMLGIDASMIEIVSDGGSHPGNAVLAWASELQPGSWFSLDHNGQVQQVQYAWRSERGQLHLFAASDGRSFVLQLRRVASYLQAGLLVPAEDEALTVRATREALAKLDANPERLLD